MLQYRVGTTLDRPPSNFFKKWIEYHIQLFDNNSFIFFNYSDNNSELEEYLISKGLDIRTFSILSHYEHWQVKEIIQNGIDLGRPFIIHYPLKYLVNNKHNVYALGIYETNNIINYIKSVTLHNKCKFIYLDLDELILCNDIHAILNESFDYIIPMGYTIIQNYDEPILDWSKPIYEQRLFWRRESFFYDKPIIVSKDLLWGVGRHYHHHTNIFAEDKSILDISPHPGIILLHLRDVCFDYLFKENQYSLELYPYSDMQHRQSWQEIQPFNQWINEERRVSLTPIPTDVLSLFTKYHI
jgi:hypothetical protein